jgi:xanthine/uracil permease
MNSILAFLLLCIPARIFLAYLSQIVPDKYLKLYGTLLLVIGLSFLYLYFNNLRLYSPEAGGKTWWAQFRLIIGSLYIIAAIYSFQGERSLIWIPLAMDIIFGLIIFSLRRFSKTDSY